MARDFLMDEDAREFWEGAKNGRLMIQRCDDCGKFIFYPRAICPHCFSERVRWIESAGKGSVYSYTVVYQGMGNRETPYAVGLIDLDEGVRMTARIAGDPRRIAIGSRVSVHFEQVDEELTLPCFHLDP